MANSHLETDLDVLGEQIAKRVSEIEEKDRQLATGGFNSISERVRELQSNVLIVIHDYIRTGLFEADKLTIASLITFRILHEEGVLNQLYLDVLFKGRVAEETPNRGEELSKWMSSVMWGRLKALEEDIGAAGSQFGNEVMPLLDHIQTRFQFESKSLIESNFNSPSIHINTSINASASIINSLEDVHANININEANRVVGYENICEKILSDVEEWEDWYYSNNVDVRPMPGDFRELSLTQRLQIIRILRPDKFQTTITTYIRSFLGERFLPQVQPFNLNSIYQYSTAKTPLLFILYPGVDPTIWVESLATSRNISTKSGSFMNISMGQGQEARANQAIQVLSKQGGWLLLQNVHLMQSWLPVLAETLETLQPDPKFRLFLTAEPPPIPNLCNIPEGLLQSCITISNEPSSDIQSNLSRAWGQFNADQITSANKPEIMKGCLFGLCYFHRCNNHLFLYSSRLC